ncbi:MAG: hypothetical protein M1838_002814 [Thelocarpon superellum]|nr:MAG: hypothetical protein M1838_002814 [Thelocarpon superellum]
MPRPKRTKFAPAPVRGGRKTTARSTPTAGPSVPPHVVARDTDGSDDSTGLVRSVAKTQRQLRAAQTQKNVMSGGLGPGDTVLTPANAATRAELSRVTREADHAIALNRLKKRREEAMRKDVAPQGDVIQVPSTMEKGAVSMMSTTKEAPVGLPRGTPASERSILALTNFKRRPRQPSILRMVEMSQLEGGDASDDDLDDFDPDDESTPLRVSKTWSPAAPDKAVVSSTPIISSGSRKRKLMPRNDPEPAIHSSPPPSVAAPHPSNSGSRNGPEEASQLLPRTSPRQEMRDVSAQPPSGTMAPPLSSSGPPSPQHPPPASPRHSRRQAPSGVCRTQGPAASRRQPSRATRMTAEPAAAPLSSPAASPLPQSHKSAYTQQRGARQAPTPAVLSTATLQNLLPRRRRKAPAPDAFDLCSSDVEIGTTALAADDELTHLNARPLIARSRTTSAKSVLKSTTQTHASASSTTVTPAPGKVYASRRARARRATATSNKENAGAGGNENEDGDSLGPTNITSFEDEDEDGAEMDDDSLEIERGRGAGGGRRRRAGLKGDGDKAGRRKKELHSLASKFKEVDRWTLDFEVVTASSSSPADAR